MKPSTTKKKPAATTGAAERRRLSAGPKHSREMADLYRRAKAQMRKQRKGWKPPGGTAKSAADPERLFHELQVHQVELEMQNAELQMARDRLEPLLEKYADLYDFAPVGYFSLDESGRILEVNLMGAAMLGLERSRLVGRPLSRFAAAVSRSGFLIFLKRVFAETGKQQVCEASLLKDGAPEFWAGLHGVSALSTSGPGKWSRVAVSDITSIKQAEEAQRRLEVLAFANSELKREIVQRQEVEKSLKLSEEQTRELLNRAHLMQEELRQLSRKVLHAQEEERKRISRELHDVIAQTLTGINVRLAALKKEAGLDTKGLGRSITLTQRLVEKSVNTVHQFARELRPSVLDDLGLIPALHAFMKDFTARTGVRTHLKAFAEVEQMASSHRTIFFRVAQESFANVSRHAQASRVEVSIQKLPNAIGMTIKDDGRSFKVDHVMRGQGNKRLGLLGMRERLEMVGGNFNVVSTPGKGTTIEAQIPLRKTRGGGGGADSAR